MKKINEMKTATNRNQENRKEVKNMNKKGNIRTKVAASVLSGLTVFSVVSMSMAGVMAAAKDEVLKTVYNEKTIFYSDNYKGIVMNSFPGKDPVAAEFPRGFCPVPLPSCGKASWE